MVGLHETFHLTPMQNTVQKNNRPHQEVFAPRQYSLVVWLLLGVELPRLQIFCISHIQLAIQDHTTIFQSPLEKEELEKWLMQILVHNTEAFEVSYLKLNLLHLLFEDEENSQLS